jgi:cyclohexanone monooxygenase
VAGEFAARFVVMATGALSTASLPKIPGIERFAGRSFHTGRWPDEHVDFNGRRVGVIGTGSSAVQAIPLIAQQARQLFVFQRTATYSVPARNGPTDRSREAEVKANYADFRARNDRTVPGFGAAYPRHQDSALAATPQERERRFEERWQLGGLYFMGAFGDLILNRDANELAAEFVRRKIRETVHDPRVAALLCPTHPIGCKRLCADSGYYETFNRPNVTLVDVSRAPIEAITPEGLATGGCHYALDDLVFATGFDAMTGTLKRMDIRGRGGLALADKWAAGPRTWLGLGVAGFPNLFVITGPGSPSVLTNMLVSIHQQVNWIAECVAYLDAHRHATIEARPESEDAWVAHVNAVADATLYPGCNSWYLGANVPGKPRVFMPLLGFPAYADKCAEVAARGYEGFVLGAPHEV